MTTETSKTPLFSELALSKPVFKALADVGYESPTPIQAEIIPHMLDGKDVVGQAQTGTGKTAAFAMPILSQIDIKVGIPQALVLAPTRELAIQVAEAFQRYAKHIKNFHVLPIYGGQDIEGQLRRLKRGVHVVVGTPGRVMDHMRRKSLRLDSLKCMILDEADEMLRMGFIDDVEWILEKTPADRQISLFSATMPKEIRRIAKRHLNDPVEIHIKSKTATVEATRQRYWMVSGMDHKMDVLTRILEAENFDGVIIFVRTKTATGEIAEKLSARGYACAPLNGDIAQNQRERTISQLKSGKLNIIVATDVAARGLDVERISHVINFDIPYDTESYVHRIGRTGRAGRSGEAILFVAPRERHFLEDIQKATRQKIELMELPSAETINDQRIERFKQRITDILAREDLTLYSQIVEQYRQEHNIPALDIAAALAKMGQGDDPLLLKDKPVRKLRENSSKQSFSHKTDPRERSEPRTRGPRRSRSEAGMETYRIEVGTKHGVQPGNIVGAIANESGIDPEDLGRIDIQDSYSTIDMRSGIPRHVWRMLKKVRVAGQELNISKSESSQSSKPGRKNSSERPKRRPGPRRER